MRRSGAPTTTEQPIVLTRQQARRICLYATGLSGSAGDVAQVLERQFSIKLDFTEAVARSHDHLFFSRLGAGVPGDVCDRLRGDGGAIELHGRLIASHDLALFRADLDTWPPPDLNRYGSPEWMLANESCRRDILDELRSNGPLVAEDLPDTCELPWRSTGWTNNKNVQKMLDLMEACGQVAVVGRRGRARLWDLPERVWPEVEAVGVEHAARIRAERRLAAHGLLRPVRGAEPVGRAAVIDGVRGRWQLAEAALGWLDDGSLTSEWVARTVIVSPLDPIVFDRKRLAELFEFDYQLEMYKPTHLRQWGYWALPVLHHDQFVGKIDATADRDSQRLYVDALHTENGCGNRCEWTSTVHAAVAEQLSQLASWLQLELTIIEQGSS